MSFFNEFNHVVPYFVKVNVGKNKQFKTDVSKKSAVNHQGKMVAFYKRAKTVEDLEKHGLGEYIEYLPAQEVSMPIDIQITADEQVTPVFEEHSKYTDKKITNHRIRIFNKDKVQVGCAFVHLTPAGDIDSKTCFYQNPDKTEEIMHTIYNKINNEKSSKDEHFSFKRNSKAGTKKVEISQRDGRVVGASVLEQELETAQDVAFQSITELGVDENTPKLKTYVASCVIDESEREKRGGTLIPWECMTLEEDLFNADSNNNFLKHFKGSYIGNILRLTPNGYEACIVTKHQKDGKSYRIYTLIDFSGTNITRGTGLDEYMGEDRDPQYFERLRNSDKTPTFITIIDENGNEKLVLYKGNAVHGECAEYNEFVENFIAPFSDIKPIQISKILNKENKKTK